MRPLGVVLLCVVGGLLAFYGIGNLAGPGLKEVIIGFGLLILVLLVFGFTIRLSRRDRE